MQPLGVFTAELHELAGCLVCENTEELMLALSWHGPTEMGRRNVLQAVQVRFTDRCVALSSSTNSPTRGIAHVLKCLPKADSQLHCR